MNKTYKDFGSAKHQDRCATLENDSVAAFLSYCKDHGFHVRKSTESQDKFSHTDYFVTVNGREYSVDIKGKKRFADEGLFLVEILNVAGNRGWLLGKADIIAFEVEGGGFFFVRRDYLFKFLKCKMNLVIMTKGGINVYVGNGKRLNTLPVMAPDYYSRAERPREMITYVNKKDLIEGNFSLANLVGA